jgi:2-C-methyl-D-erythritol 4-phosphate cytidylyltransferase
VIAAADIWAVVPAAGVGVRMQADIPKQYLPLLGRPTILHTLERLCSYPRVRGVLVGIAPGDSHWAMLASTKLDKLLGVYTGGCLRAQTVLHGLNTLAPQARDSDWVMVHDAVRPCVRHADLDKLVSAVQTHPDGALLALPLTDTLKRADTDGRVQQTVPRAQLWRALTPQMFRLGRLRDALAAALALGEDPTDEAAAMEAVGARPLIVEGQPDNIKITRPVDIDLAALYLKQQREDGA